MHFTDQRSGVKNIVTETYCYSKHFFTGLGFKTCLQIFAIEAFEVLRRKYCCKIFHNFNGEKYIGRLHPAPFKKLIFALKNIAKLQESGSLFLVCYFKICRTSYNKWPRSTIQLLAKANLQTCQNRLIAVLRKCCLQIYPARCYVPLCSLSL